MEGEVKVVVFSKLKPECLEAAKPHSIKLFELSKKEEGNLQYDWYEDIKEPGSGVAIEKWKSMEAFQAHFHSNHVKEFGELAKEWVAGPVVGRVLKPENVWA